MGVYGLEIQDYHFFFWGGGEGFGTKVTGQGLALRGKSFGIRISGFVTLNPNSVSSRLAANYRGARSMVEDGVAI